MIEKPEVLSDEEIYQACINAVELNPYKELDTVQFSMPYATAKAQRDADAEYYEKVIAEIFEKIEYMFGMPTYWQNAEAANAWLSFKQKYGGK